MNLFVTLLILKDYFIAITLQFIDNEWRLWNIPLAFTEVVGPHTKEAIGSLIAQVLSFYLGFILNSTSVLFSFYFMSAETNFSGENVRLRQSKPFEELWNECCRVSLGKEVILQPDTPTRWSSTVNMLCKAVEVKLAVERMVIASNEKKNHEVNFRIF